MKERWGLLQQKEIPSRFNRSVDEVCTSSTSHSSVSNAPDWFASHK